MIKRNKSDSLDFSDLENGRVVGRLSKIRSGILSRSLSSGSQVAMSSWQWIREPRAQEEECRCTFGGVCMQNNLALLRLCKNPRWCINTDKGSSVIGSEDKSR